MEKRSDQVSQLELEISELKARLVAKENQLQILKNCKTGNPYCEDLSTEEIIRYSRQIIMPEIRVNGQVTLKNSNVLIVGTGGLGCPSALYLAAAGVGNITLSDYDTVELSNLHRQVLHSELTVGLEKVLSAKETLNRINKNVNIKTLNIHLNSTNISNVLEGFDVVVDGSDNVATRYLLNDACVIAGKPLVSGSALQWEGQLTVYGYKGGPCYRCLFPIPPPPETVTSCGDGGVLGVVPGCIGVLQALETIKILLNMPHILSGRMLMFDGSDSTFRNITLRKRNINCVVCGDNPTVTKPIDYEQFCQSNAHDKGDSVNILSVDERITVTEFSEIIKSKSDNLLVIDVRPNTQFEMCHLPNSVNIPFTDIQNNKHFEQMKSIINVENAIKNEMPVYVLCRRGNDSQRAVKILREQFNLNFQDITGGLHAYSAKIDRRFPVY